MNRDNHLSKKNDVKLGLFVRLESKPGKENEILKFLHSGLTLVEEEPDTTVWFALRLGKSTFGIFDGFPNEAGREAHLAGKVAKALFAAAPDLFSKPPALEKIEILDAKH